jgi:hypothetical protein
MFQINHTSAKAFVQMKNGEHNMINLRFPYTIFFFNCHLLDHQEHCDLIYGQKLYVGVQSDPGSLCSTDEVFFMGTEVNQCDFELEPKMSTSLAIIPQTTFGFEAIVSLSWAIYLAVSDSFECATTSVSWICTGYVVNIVSHSFLSGGVMLLWIVQFFGADVMVWVDYYGYLKGTLWMLLLPSMYLIMIGIWRG